MNSNDFTRILMNLLDLDEDNDDIASVRDYRDAGVLTYDDGIVVRMTDGSEFQVTVQQSQ